MYGLPDSLGYFKCGYSGGRLVPGHPTVLLGEDKVLHVGVTL